MRRIFVATSITVLISSLFSPKAFAQLPIPIDDRLSLISTTTRRDPASVQGGPAGTFTITATFKSISFNNITGLSFLVALLTPIGENLLLNADGGAGRLSLTVPLAGNYSDGVLSPGETFRVNFIIGLASLNRFFFEVFALGAVDCGLPGPDQVIIYTGRDRGGFCAKLGVGNYPNASAFGLPNDAISSIDVGIDVRTVLYEHDSFRGRQAHYEGGLYYSPIGNVAGKTSSIEIFRQQGGPAAALYLGDFPSHSQSFWAEAAQGLANDGENWFVIKAVRNLKVPLSFSLDSDNSRGLVTTLMPDALKCVYNHFGDADQNSGFLFVPLECSKSGDDFPESCPGEGTGDAKCTEDERSTPSIGVFSTVDLQFLARRASCRAWRARPGWPSAPTKESVRSGLPSLTSPRATSSSACTTSTGSC